jgi:hypothetical protein
LTPEVARPVLAFVRESPSPVGIASINKGLGRLMQIAARMAPCAAGTMPGYGYDGCNILIRELDEAGFAADARVEIAGGSIVRIKLPGAGSMLARVDTVEDRGIRASFLNPVSKARLGMTLGMAIR